MIEPTPALIAATYGGKNNFRNVASSQMVLPWSMPLVVPPSPMKCFAHARTDVGSAESF
jgi:hypothetical protein